METSFEVKDAQLALRPLIEKIRRAVFTPEYQDRATDAECLGILLAKFFEWSGEDILDAAEAGLEDSNFHTEARAIAELKGKIKS